MDKKELKKDLLSKERFRKFMQEFEEGIQKRLDNYINFRKDYDTFLELMPRLLSLQIEQPKLMKELGLELEIKEIKEIKEAFKTITKNEKKDIKISSDMCLNWNYAKNSVSSGCVSQGRVPNEYILKATVAERFPNHCALSLGANCDTCDLRYECLFPKFKKELSE